jgi:hypothetical protein
MACTPKTQEAGLIAAVQELAWLHGGADHVLTLAVLVPADSAASRTQPVVRRRSVWAVAA